MATAKNSQPRVYFRETKSTTVITAENNAGTPNVLTSVPNACVALNFLPRATVTTMIVHP